MFGRKKAREFAKLEERLEDVERKQKAEEERIREESYCKEVCTEARKAAVLAIPAKMGDWGYKVIDYPAIRAMGYRLQKLANDGYIMLDKKKAKSKKE